MDFYEDSLFSIFVKNLKFIWNFLDGEKTNLIKFIILNIFVIIISIITPILSAQIIIGITSVELYGIIFIAIILLICETVYNLFHNYSKIILNDIYYKILSNLEIELGELILRLENNVLDESGSGLFLQRLSVDATRLTEVFNEIVALIPLLLKNIGILFAIFIISREVFLFLIFGLFIKYLFENRRAKIRNVDDKDTRQSYEKVSGFIIELVNGTKDIKLLNSESNLIKVFNPLFKNFVDKKIDLESKSRINRAISDEIGSILDFLLIVLIIYLLMIKNITPALALILFNYSINLGKITGILEDLFEYIQDFNLSSERIQELFDDNKFKKEKFGNKHLNEVKGFIEFKNVEFGYDENIILKDLSFKVNSKESIAIVGRSGVGKTTIFNLLSKMYDINKGEILIDGINIKDLDKNSLRNNISIISQNPYIFNLSIKDNLRLVKPDLTEDEMIKSCENAYLTNFINQLPDKYDTIIGENGVRLSGGQKQRVAIARLFVKNTKIILLDEATSTLDNKTQKQIQNSINNIKGNHTIIMIAHRLSTIINCDRILFLDDGEIKAEGTHEELMENYLPYKNLYETEILKNN